MSSYEEIPSPHEYGEQVLADTQATLKAAVGIVSPENPGADPQEIFPKPNVPVRAEGPEPMELTDEQKEQLLARAEELGFGRPESVGLSEQGLQSSIAVIEGGQPHKMLAELRLIAEDPNASSLRAIVVTASRQRGVTDPAELESASNLFGGDQAGKSEYEMALQALGLIQGFRRPREDEVKGDSGFGYDIHDNYRVSQVLRWYNGQDIRVGYLDADGIPVPVNMLRVDREDYVDENDRPKYRNQPDTAEKIKIVNDIFKLQQSHADYRNPAPIAFVTSGVYRPSRAVLTALAGLRLDRHVGLVTYGNDLVNEVRGTESPAPLGQLPGELQYMAEKAVELEQELRA